MQQYFSPQPNILLLITDVRQSYVCFMFSYLEQTESFSPPVFPVLNSSAKNLHVLTKMAEAFTSPQLSDGSIAFLKNQ